MKEDLEKPSAQKVMSFGDHLDELRKRLIYSLIAIGAGTIASFCVREKFLALVESPHAWAMNSLGIEPHMYVFRYQETFLAQLKVFFVGGLLFSSPYVFYQLWKFFGEALHGDEKRTFWQFFPPALLLFATGITFGYTILIPYGLLFLTKFGLAVNLAPMINFGNYVSLFLLLTLTVGAVFELPLVMVFLVQANIVCSHTLRKKRRIAILTIVTAAALLTPPDPVTQIMMATPLIILYEIGCFASRIAEKRRLAPAPSKI